MTRTPINPLQVIWNQDVLCRERARFVLGATL